MTTKEQESVQDEAERLLQDIPTDWRWSQCYEMGDRTFHWALETEESAAQGQVVDCYSVLLCDFEKAMDGRIVSDTPVLKFIAAAPRLVRGLLAEIASLREARAWQPIETATVQKLADTFAMEYLTGHYRPLRDDERQRFDQLRVVLLAFAAQIQKPLPEPPK